MEKRDRRYRTFRLRPADKLLLQSLGGGEDEPDRHHALLSLVQIVEKLQLPDIRNETRQPLRLGIPAQLDKVIRRKADATGQAYVDVLLAAAQDHQKSKQETGRPPPKIKSSRSR